mmetsp:Transcript_88588/g.236813  ORF Transcript_88588/g.236813 Transcript_88588/m.236813 type:complete len:245 (+) Transcript_88588:1698-2432(+)
MTTQPSEVGVEHRKLLGNEPALRDLGLGAREVGPDLEERGGTSDAYLVKDNHSFGHDGHICVAQQAQQDLPQRVKLVGVQVEDLGHHRCGGLTDVRGRVRHGFSQCGHHDLNDLEHLDAAQRPQRRRSHELASVAEIPLHGVNGHQSEVPVVFRILHEIDVRQFLQFQALCGHQLHHITEQPPHIPPGGHRSQHPFHGVQLLLKQIAVQVLPHLVLAEPVLIEVADFGRRYRCHHAAHSGTHLV